MSRHLLEGLIKRGFDVANVGKLRSARQPGPRRLAHGLSNLVPEVDPELRIPLVCVFLNEYFPPLPSAQRCAQLGAAIGQILSERPERIAIYASGGLSHFPGMFNAGWIDQPLDRWILERLERNDLAALEHLFTFDSDTMRSGTGEVRAWISAAAAMNRPATVRGIHRGPLHADRLRLRLLAGMNGNGALPLARYTVLDLTRARAGPTCVRQLVDWGAHAIKIEMPGGPLGRRHGRQPPRLRLPEPAPQQASHHPEPARARGRGHLQAARDGRRRRGRELPARTSSAASASTTRACARSTRG